MANQNKVATTHSKIKLIYNPNAGKKRGLIPKPGTPTIDTIKELLVQYQIPVDFAPTKRAGHATKLAEKAVKEKYNLVLAAGGDGTVNEVAEALVNTDVTLGIIPMGSIMNIARMLAIPLEIEKAIALIKIGRTRKIDVGCVTQLNGEKLSEPHYFIENAGVGLEAQIQRCILDIEQGNTLALVNIIKSFANFKNFKAQVATDEEKIDVQAGLIEISNGPISGAALEFAPEAKLNDHRLTVSIFTMSRLELAKYFFDQFVTGKAESIHIKRHQATKVKIITKRHRIIHANATVFGKTPAEFTVIPNALNVITGFPKPDEDSSLERRSPLDPH